MKACQAFPLSGVRKVVGGWTGELAGSVGVEEVAEAAGKTRGGSGGSAGGTVRGTLDAVARVEEGVQRARVEAAVVEVFDLSHGAGQAIRRGWSTAGCTSSMAVLAYHGS